MHDELMYREEELVPPAFGDLLRSPYEEHFGPDTEITKKGLTIRVADRPVAKSVRRLYELSHKTLPPGLAVFDAYDIWIVAHGVGVIRTAGSGAIRSIGYEADFGDSDDVLTIDLLPQTKFKKHLTAEMRMEADLGAEGHAELPEPAREILDLVHTIGGDARIRLSSDVSVVGRVSLSIMTPTVQAVGKMGSRCQWQFDLDTEPILGDQIMLQTILVPIGTRSISYRVRARALMKTSWVSFAVPRQTKWIDVTCELA